VFVDLCKQADAQRVKRNRPIFKNICKKEKENDFDNNIVTI